MTEINKICCFLHPFHLSNTLLINIGKYFEGNNYKLHIFSSYKLHKIFNEKKIEHEYFDINIIKSCELIKLNYLNNINNEIIIIANNSFYSLTDENISRISYLRLLASNLNNVRILMDENDCLNLLNQQSPWSFSNRSLKSLASKVYQYSTAIDNLLTQHIVQNINLINRYNILVIGSGGREHAIVRSITQSDNVDKLYALPGNSGTASEVTKYGNRCCNISHVKLDNNFNDLLNFIKENNINMVIVGPEQPLADGISDVLTSNGILCFGPKKNAAILESSKAWSKEFMAKYNLPTAKFKTFSDFTLAKEYIETIDFNVVVKPSTR